MLQKLINKLLQIYKTPVREFTGAQKQIFRFCKIVILSTRSFIEDRCILRASALTFYSLMSIVPVIAMSFAIAKGFGYQLHLEKELLERFKEHKEFIEQVIIFSKNFLEDTKGGIIAGIGLVVLFWSVIKVLNHIEGALNNIWGITKQRSWRRKFSDYFAMMFIGPIIFLMAGSVTVFIVGKLKTYVEGLSLHETISTPILFLIQFSPYGLIWVLFTFIYIFMPNTKVKISAAFMGAIVGGSAYQIVQWIYLKFQISAAKLGAIYGSFAALPLFLVWMQLSWIIVLAGAEMSFAWQNFDIYEFGDKKKNISHRMKILLSLFVVHICVKRFLYGEKALNLKQIHKVTNVPLFFLNTILNELVDCKVLVQSQENGMGFQPARSLMNLKVKDVIDQLERHGIDEIPNIQYEKKEVFDKILDRFSDTLANCSDNILLKDL